MRILVGGDLCGARDCWFGAARENWPQWRGPSANGISAETNLPVKWTTTENIAWKLPLPAWSGSTPIVWGDRIFLNVAENGSLFLWAVDRNKGEADLEAASERWRSSRAQAEHVDAVAGHRRHQRVGDDRHRHPERRSISAAKSSGCATSRRNTAVSV